MLNKKFSPEEKMQLFFQEKRLIQIFWALEFTLMLILIQRPVMGRLVLAIVVAVVMIALVPVYTQAKKDM